MFLIVASLHKLLNAALILMARVVREPFGASSRGPETGLWETRQLSFNQILGKLDMNSQMDWLLKSTYCASGLANAVGE